MTGAEQIPEEQRRGYAAQEPYDNGEERLPRFEDDGSGYCLHCRRSLMFHREASFCPVVVK